MSARNRCAVDSNRWTPNKVESGKPRRFKEVEKGGEEGGVVGSVFRFKAVYKIG